jgi:hypothetical protein
MRLKEISIYNFRCRKDYANKLLVNNDKNTLLVRVSPSFIFSIFNRPNSIFLEKQETLSKS